MNNLYIEEIQKPYSRMATEAEINAQRSKPEKQYMFVPCTECNELVTQDLTDDTPATEHGFTPLPIFEGDTYIAWFDKDTWQCFPCSEKTWKEWREDGETPKWECDFVNGRGGWDCKGCDNCNDRRVTQANGDPYMYFVRDK